MKKLTTNTFIEKAMSKHNGIYSYNKTVYVKSNLSVIISCRKHGDFLQQPNNHLFGNGCPRCRNIAFGESRRSNLNHFIDKANRIHQNKFDYSKTIYQRWDMDVIIGCPIHGDFHQRPNNHLNGQGCPVCANGQRRLSKRIGTTKFVERSNFVHRNTYSYEKVDYKNSATPVTITCAIHGDFQQQPLNHLSGRGCRKCGFIVTEPRRKVTTEQFIEKAKEVHGTTYAYNKFTYINNNTKSYITCFKHGDFKQSGASHLTGSGCPRCKESRGERAINNLLKELDIVYIRQYKIEECKNKYKLPFDFAIFSKNKLCGLIEFQGKQHFYPVKCWGGIKTLRYIQRNDRIKKQYCENNSIPFAIILYKDNLRKDVIEFIDSLIKPI